MFITMQLKFTEKECILIVLELISFNTNIFMNQLPGLYTSVRTVGLHFLPFIFTVLCGGF